MTPASLGAVILSNDAGRLATEALAAGAAAAAGLGAVVAAVAPRAAVSGVLLPEQPEQSISPAASAPAELQIRACSTFVSPIEGDEYSTSITSNPSGRRRVPKRSVQAIRRGDRSVSGTRRRRASASPPNRSPWAR